MPSHKSLSEESGAAIYGEESGVQADFGASTFQAVSHQAAPPKKSFFGPAAHALKPEFRSGTRMQTLNPRLTGAAALVATTAVNPFALSPIVDDGSGTSDGSNGSSASGNGGSAAPSSDDLGDQSDDGYDGDDYADDGSDDGGGDAYSDDGSSGDDFDDGSDWSE